MTTSVISFINMKGGVGKTTLCVGIAEYLANYMDKKVLIIDIDPQFNATQSILSKYNKVDEYISDHLENTKTIRRIFETKTSLTGKVQQVTPDEIIIAMSENLHMIFGDINTIFDIEQPAARLNKLKRFIEENNLREVYDFILIDSPPTISLFTDAALVASDYYIVPVKIDHYSILGATSLLSVIDNIKESYDHKSIRNLGFIYTNTFESPSQKTQRLKSNFESTEPFNELYFFNNQLKFVQDLMVGGRGNIASSYKLSRNYIKGICEEFINRLQQIQEDGDDE
ncbi:AAA family ATPase [Cronobacter sakazakii]|uniref:ParA family protein n=1 Tax=Cronobacter sakazakii TaxID=28141 RepID=UPI000BE82849|nr:AAA family ATPase [Cronobacter sakazakii]ELY6201639.1 AAA family ATPase [Cronobacter sakazakii]NCH92774.1 ParA family protein [Cronobacter sakazakii]NHV91980.1 AAA family ATPase [Cronobacter sakazakii]PQV66019.1 chromosome partitioning protein ParA [Cronobacter sakazakii]PQY13201.1 chromosome partitioning protein ParA [Cronobacter sakazakii]